MGDVPNLVTELLALLWLAKSEMRQSLAHHKEEEIGLEHCCSTHEPACNQAARCEVSPRTIAAALMFSQGTNQLFLAGR
jgi:hypothetical protein